MLEHLFPTPITPSRVVVMGSHGFVGAAIERRLMHAGVPALGLGRNDVDLLDKRAAAQLAAFLRPGDAFVAVSALAPCKTADMLVDNMAMARAMVTALAASQISHVVNISSDAVYADAATPLTEQSPTAPDTLHGAMHLARELMFRNSVAHAPLACLRPSLLYGAADPHNGYGPNRFRRLAQKGQPIVLFGEGEERRDHVYIDDVAELDLRTLLHRSRGTLNIATGTVRSFREVAAEAVRVSGSASVIQGSPRTGPMPHNGYRAFDNTATRLAFPDFQYTPLAAGLALAAGV